ncbi:D-alanyl-D-alanine carboxypeptidase family protein [Clostridium sp. ZS2-4]|uniref:D-alanyl-D-alanine carboxypeptidase family protein n=1 Tax=Clostridium sp. ZS2-4 TaxID=2987703 RepID=UPI00227A3815|nr:D-alanyl-D-alanine carboxypeptidase family protein [Clostridium sp. ZS2-4]MCY6354336.1 D-alanyl-D-alanine carboxypeptidase [Clostridium sp. ZS2-4]
MKNKHIVAVLISILVSINILASSVIAKPMQIDARSAVAIDSKSRCVLYEKNSNMLIPIASTTKIMTTLVTLKYGNLDKEIEISSNAANIHGSEVGYKKGDIITLRELLYGLMLRSGNDAAIAIAEGMCGSVDEFLKLMNEYAEEIGVTNTHFESPHGLDSQYHYSTAYDLALVTAKAKENKLFNQIVSIKDVDAEEYGFTRSYHNINKILYQIPGANGVKTGYTGNAGKCLVTSVNMGEDDIIIVVLNCNKRWNETKKIYDYVKDNYEFKKVVSKGQIVDKYNHNEKTEINLICDEDIIIPFKKGDSYETKIIKPKSIKNSLRKNDDLGKISIYKNGEVIYSKSLKCGENIHVNTPITFKEVIGKLFKGK